MSLESIRSEIDAVDARMVVLLAQRWRLVREAVRYKSTEEQLEARDRQQQVIGNVRRMAEQQGVPAHLAEAVYRTMMAEFVQLQRREMGL